MCRALARIQRKNCEAIALAFGECPRKLQRFLESSSGMNRSFATAANRSLLAIARCQAIGLIDKSGTHKSGKHTAGVARQYNGNRGKIENCIVGVHIGYSAPGFQGLLDSRLYLPQDWASDPVRRKKTTYPTTSSFKPNWKSPSTWSVMPCQWDHSQGMDIRRAVRRQYRFSR